MFLVIAFTFNYNLLNNILAKNQLRGSCIVVEKFNDRK
jgi:hypothetical protein